MPRKPRVPVQRVRLSPGGPRLSLGPRNAHLKDLYEFQSPLSTRTDLDRRKDYEQENTRYRLFRKALDLAHQAIDRLYLEKFPPVSKSQARRKGSRNMNPEHASQESVPLRLTRDEMDDLLSRATKEDPAALEQLRQIVASAPLQWQDANSMVNLSRQLFLRQLERFGTVSATAMQGTLTSTLDHIQSQKHSDPLENLLLEHLQMTIMATSYNSFLLLDSRLSVRRRAALERRVEQAETKVADALKKVQECRIVQLLADIQVPESNNNAAQQPKASASPDGASPTR
jgi:hypothetical protein